MEADVYRTEKEAERNWERAYDALADRGVEQCIPSDVYEDENGRWHYRMSGWARGGWAAFISCCDRSTVWKGGYNSLGYREGVPVSSRRAAYDHLARQGYVL